MEPAYWYFIHCFHISFRQVVKFLVERNTNNLLHGQVTIGTLIFQVSFTLKVDGSGQSWILIL